MRKSAPSCGNRYDQVRKHASSTGRKTVQVSHVGRSVLIIHRHENNIPRLHEHLVDVAIKSLGPGHVLFFTIKKVEGFSQKAREQFSDLFKSFIFFYIPSIDELVKKIIDLQRWENCLPCLIIIESLDLMKLVEDVCPLSQHALLMASLADTVQVISTKRQSDCKSIITVSDDTLNDFPIEIFTKECFVLNEEKISDSSEILSVLAKMTYNYTTVYK